MTERPAALALGALTLRRIRELEAEIVAARQAAGDANLHLLQGPDLFGPDDVGDLPDGLHPNAGRLPAHGRALPRPRLPGRRALRG